MSRLNELLYGDLLEIAGYLDTTEEDLSQEEAKAVLTNLCRKVAAIEKRHAERDKDLAETVGG